MLSSLAARVTVRRSARRVTVRAISSEALTRVSPGTTNSVGSVIAASVSARVAPRASTIASLTRVVPSCCRSRAPGVVASSAPTTNSSRWRRRIVSARLPKLCDSTPYCCFIPSSARASPSAATASSTVPYASVRRSSLRTRSPPKRRPVVPSSPLPVATTESNGSVDRVMRWSSGRSCGRCSPRSPHQAGVARIPALRQQGDLDVVLDHALGLLLDLRDHGAGVRAERGGEDHLHLGRVLAEDDLLDERELDDVHADLGIHDGSQRIEDRELRRAPLRVEGGGCGDGGAGGGLRVGHRG